MAGLTGCFASVNGRLKELEVIVLVLDTMTGEVMGSLLSRVTVYDPPLLRWTPRILYTNTIKRSRFSREIRDVLHEHQQK